LDNITDHFLNRSAGGEPDSGHGGGHGSGSCVAPVIEINRRHVFSLDEAKEVLPIIFRITKASSQKVDVLIERLESLGGSNEDLTNAIESQVNTLIQDWQNKIQKLGALPKGLWIADFDAGDGYFCWKYPERSIEFWHRYSDGFSKRMHVGERCQHISLQERLKQKIFSITPQLTP
jgi:hypothetical protein